MTDNQNTTIETTETTPAPRFADLELDASPVVDPAPVAETPDVRPPLEIDGVQGVYDTPESDVGPTGPTVQALREAELDFPVKLVQPDLPGFPASPNIADHRFCARADNGYVFGVSVSPGYGFVQPSELAATFDAALPEGVGDVKVESSLMGERIWFTCDLPMSKMLEIHPDIQAVADALPQYGESHLVDGHTSITFRLLGHHAYGGKGSLDISLLMEALVCSNGMRVPVMDGNRKVSIRHTCNFEQRVSMLQKAFSLAGGMVEALSGMFADMAGTRITATQFDQYCKAMFPGESTQAKNKRKELEKAYVSAPGAAPGTAWGALQAGTYYGTHLTPVRVGGRSLSRFTLDDPDSVTPAQLEGYQGQARLESMVYGPAGGFTERAFQYVTTNLLGAA
ncbi:MAG: DUF932 domain-containing protein [Candidatus Altiarchaeales archaeon]|nr:DUF932 domain-containing protein [Candidatus Altiarchaeales archaeon]